MKGKWIYVALSGLLGIVVAMESHYLYLVILLVYLFWIFRFKKLSKKKIPILVIVFVLFFIRGELDEKYNHTVLSGKETTFTVMLQEPLKIDGNLLSAYVKEKKHGEKLLLQYTISSEKEKNSLERLSAGTVCTVLGELELPGPARNVNAFDYQRYLYHKDVFWVLKTVNLTPTSSIKSSGPILFMKNLRQKGISHIYNHFPKEIAPLSAALIFGDRTTMEPDLLAAYESLGIVHLLAISGLHVGMLAGLLYYLCLRLRMTREKAADILIIFLPIYSILTGASPSVLRACAMMLIVLLFAKFTRKFKNAPLDIISLVFFFYIFMEPNAIYDVGFQLSFLITFSLLLSAPLLRKYRFKPVRLLICTSFIAMLSSVPIMLYHFYEFSLLSIVANIVYVPLFSMLFLPVILAVFFLHIMLGSVMAPLLILLNDVVIFVNGFTKSLSTLPFSVITLGRPPPFFLILYLIIIPFTLCCMEKTKLWKRNVLFLIFPLSVMLLQQGIALYSPQGEVTMIDVGQGDSILIKLPYNKGTYLIDTGGNLQYEGEEWKKRRDPFETGEDILVPFLKSKGITKLDKLILTHGDIDHIGGAQAVLQAIHVNEVVLPKSNESSELEKNIIKICRENKTAVHIASQGDSWGAGESHFYVLAPVYEDLSRNNQSIVLLVRLGDLDWLFTGDLETKGEALLMAHFPSLTVDVLKIGHHGSSTSTSEEFIDFLEIKTALISAGVDNRFGHPNEEVLNRLHDKDIRIYRTDKNGAISYYFRSVAGTFFTKLHTIVNDKE